MTGHKPKTLLQSLKAQYYLNILGQPRWCLKAHSDQHPPVLLPQILLKSSRAEAHYTVAMAGLHQTSDEVLEKAPEHSQDQDLPAAKEHSSEAGQSRPESVQALGKTQETEQPSAQSAKKHPRAIAAESAAEPVVSEPVTAEQSQPLFTPRSLPIETNTGVNADIAVLHEINQQIRQCDFCQQRMRGELAFHCQHFYRPAKTSRQQMEPPAPLPRILLLFTEPSTNEFYQRQYLLPDYQKMLSQLFLSLQLQAEVYISSMLKCFCYREFETTGENTEPEQYERQYRQCLQFLTREIAALSIDIVVFMGAGRRVEFLITQREQKKLQEEGICGDNLMGRCYPLDSSLAASAEIPLFISFHPSLLYRHPGFKQKAFQHWVEIVKLLKNTHGKK